MAIDLSIHTIVLHHIITRKEAEWLCKRYGVAFNKYVDIPYTNIKIAGVDNIHITSNRIPIANEAATSFNYKYDMSIRLNLGRLINDSKHLMLLWNKRNAEMVGSKINDILRREFMLKEINSNVMDWYITRIDYGMDLKIAQDDGLYADEYINYLHGLFEMRKPEGYRYLKYDGYDLPEVKFESIAIKSIDKDFTYNIYCKKAELEKKRDQNGITLTNSELQEVEGIIRIEKQVTEFSIIKRNNKKFEVLYDADTTEKAMDTVINELKELFDDDSVLVFAEDYMREYRPGVLLMTGFNSIIARNVRDRTKPRRKSDFGKPRLVTEAGRSPRYRAKISIHDASGDTYPFTLTCKVGESEMDCERKIYEKIINNFNENLNQCAYEQQQGVYECVLEELRKFSTVISLNNKGLKKDVLDHISYLEDVYKIKDTLSNMNDFEDGYVDFYGHKLRIGL